MGKIALEEPRFKALSCLLFFLGIGSAFAQAPGGILQRQGGPAGLDMPIAPPPAASAKQPAENPAAEIIIFRIRSAFSLTPVMVASLQARGSDQGSASASAAPNAQKGESSAPEKSVLISWSNALAREVPFSVPLDVRLVGKNVLALVQLTPIEIGDQDINLLVQGQVWVQKPNGMLSFNTSFQSLNIALGSRLYFYPLGVDAKNGAPIAVEIKVDRSPQQ
ncbi:MAG: hypothetical protein NT061_08845 [Spirochaetes bacterium]|nr:hypothetical protein [Spirochaetota bacterium]